MNKFIDFKFYPQQNLFIVLGFLVCAYFVFHSLHGDRSYPSLVALENSIAHAERKLKDAEAERLNLERQVKMLRPDSLHKDFLEERVRLVLGFQNINEVQILQN